jgi:hypothetical protein
MNIANPKSVALPSLGRAHAGSRNYFFETPEVGAAAAEAADEDDMAADVRDIVACDDAWAALANACALVCIADIDCIADGFAANAERAAIALAFEASALNAFWFAAIAAKALVLADSAAIAAWFDASALNEAALAAIALKAPELAASEAIALWLEASALNELAFAAITA